MPRTTSAWPNWDVPNISRQDAEEVRGYLNAGREWLKKVSGFDDEPDSEGRSEVDELMEDLNLPLVSYIAHARITDRSASLAQQRVNIQAFLDRGDHSQAALSKLDPASYGAIANRHPDGAHRFPQCDDPVAIILAAMAALSFLGPATPGRSPGSNSIARQQLAWLVAVQYYAMTKMEPKRVRDWELDKDASAFLAFVTEFVSLLPQHLRPPIDSGFIKRAVKEFKKSQTQYVDDDGRVKTRFAISIPPSDWLGSGWGE